MCKAQDKIKFTYDPLTGNQLTRNLCFGCTAKPAREIKEIVALTNADLEKFSPEDVISYYPNPVKEELYLKWELIDDNTVASVQVFSITGQVLKNYNGLDRTNNVNIPFQEFSSGIYLVQLNYSKGDPKTIKIIKK
jgi:hypothetical protein